MIGVWVMIEVVGYDRNGEICPTENSRGSGR
jgi:hypothetical protein